MSDDMSTPPPATVEPPSATIERVFLVVVDKSEEHKVALRYAALRAKRTGGRVALLYVIAPTDFQAFGSVENLIREEQRQEAETVMQGLSSEVQSICGKTPVFHIREGDVADELLALIDEDKGISVLVLAAAARGKNPGPLITALAGKMWTKLHIPMTIVPGDLSNEQLDRLA